MSQPMTPAAVHKQYDEAMTAFRRQIKDVNARVAFGREADAFMRECACGVWRAGQGVTPRHVEYYNALYAKGNPVPTVLFWELASAVEGYGGFVLPNFFRKLVHTDTWGTGPSHWQSREFVDTFTLLLLLFASVDGEVSEAEAGFINACADSLSAFCDHENVQLRQKDVEGWSLRKRSPVKPDRPENKFVESADLPDELKGKNEGSAAQPAQTKSEEAREKAQKEQEPSEQPPTLDELLAELDGLCGLAKVKEDVKGLINLVKVRGLRKESGLPVPPMSLHLVFMGNPGTGKTTVARLLAKIYRTVGVLSKGQLVEVDRSGLVAGFVGQTALKTQEAIDKALGGVLFIDEAYALANQDNANDFGREAIEVLLKGMEDHRDDLIVIVAGYTDLMGDFIHANPGLESRFNKYFYFEDYDGGQLAEIFRDLCKKNGYTLDEAADKAAAEAFELMYQRRDENFGNARDVRNIFEAAVARQANRVAALEAPGREDLMALTVADLDLEDGENSEKEAQ